MSEKNILQKCKVQFEELTSQPEDFLSTQEHLNKAAKELTKLLYDFTKKIEKPLAVTNSLPELIIDDFDEEQIWQEIELQNEDRWAHTLSHVSKLLVNKNTLKLPITISKSNHINNIENFNSENEYESSNPDNNIISKNKISNIKKKEKKNKSKENQNYERSIVDDNFFKLKEMEEFLDMQDKIEMQKEKKKNNGFNDDDEENSDDDIDLFDSLETDEECDDIDNDPKYMKYEDFFDNIEENKNDTSNEENDNCNQSSNFSEESENEESREDIDLENKLSKKNKRVSFDLPQSSSSDEDGSNELMCDSDSDSGDDSKYNNVNSGSEKKNLSEFELRQERLHRKISYLENSLLEEKNWTMKGEVDATNRPQNSLLEEVLDFDVTSRPPPVVTEETTLKLQDIIMQRIKDKVWDDVERKEKYVEKIHEFKKSVVLDQEKSKLSLAQIYENEYIRQREALNPDADEKPEEEPVAHIEIRKLMTNLFSKLDALCNFHYTPKVSIPEVKIVSNMPAISMEEVAPVATSDAMLLAPEEVKGKQKGDLIGKSERTDTDKNREHRKKKIRQREREKEKQKRDKIIQKLKPGLGNKYSKQKVAKMLDQVTKSKNVDKMEVTSNTKSLKSSSAFFTQLQDEVSSAIQSKLKARKSNSQKVITAKKLKL